MSTTSTEKRFLLAASGVFEFDTSRRALCREGIDLRLAPKEYALLTLLVDHAGNAVSKEALLSEVWPEATVGDTSLARCVSSLRRHLGIDAIQVVPKFGYRLTLPVAIGSPAEAVSTQASASQIETAESPAPPQARGAVSFRHRWLLAVAAIIVAAVSLGAIRSQWGLASTPSDLTWTDAQTGLTWQREDNGVHQSSGKADLAHAAATTYCASLRLKGLHDWRLPTMEELQTLNDPTRSVAGLWGGYRSVYWHVKGGLALSGGETASDLTWLTETTPAGEEQTYDFSYGRRNYNPVDFKADHRALCVRKP